MVTRTYKFYGKAFSMSGDVTANVTFNNQTVHSGPVPTTGEAGPVKYEGELTELFSVDLDSSILGNLPLRIEVANGDLFFGAVECNYTGTGPGLDVTQFFGDVNLNTATSDGKNNVKINDTPFAIDPSEVGNPAMIGEWVWPIREGSVFTCDLFVDPARLLTPEMIANEDLSDGGQ